MWDIVRLSGVLLGFYISQLLGISVIYTLIVYSVVMTAMYLLSIALNLKAMGNFTKRIQN